MTIEEMQRLLVERDAKLVKAGELIREMAGAIRGADEFGDFEAECKEAEEFAAELIAEGVEK